MGGSTTYGAKGKLSSDFVDLSVWDDLVSEGLRAAHCVTMLHDLGSRSRGRAFADECLVGVLGVFGVAPVDEAVVRRALAMGWPDFEDAVCCAAGEAAGCHAIATRDPGG